MGVPRFYRWISERYPKINSIISELSLMPEFDNLYLDMNGIIHACSHGSVGDDEVCPMPDEKEMMEAIFGYVDRIVMEIVKPLKVLFIAVDGVAPRAKLNQQRSRRFGSSREAREARAGGERSSNEFDSNCITPGTEFMTRIGDQLREFVRLRMKEGAWGPIKVVFSGADFPGEGEHKIMQYIRENREGRHCMYGNDADLLMLALVTHEPQFTLLREIIDFGANARSRDTPANARKTKTRRAKTSDFQLLHLSILREYLHLEFCVRDGEKGPEPWNLERLLDDFVLMTFFVGNDFLPHSPSLEITENAFDRLFEAYYKLKKEKWGIDGYLTEKGRIVDGERLASFVRALADMEPEIFAQREKKLAKQRKSRRGSDKDASFSKSSGPPTRTDYYEKCLAPRAASSAFLAANDTPEKAALALGGAFVEGLQWCLAYYCIGCVDWAWFYPCHYCPYLGDVAASLPSSLRTFDNLGEPLRPLEQLMACLPPDSARLLPKPLGELMVNPSSPVLDMYPREFDVDIPHGKRNAWEGVNLLPFIDMDRLLDAVRSSPRHRQLNDERRARFGRMIQVVRRSKNNDRNGARSSGQDTVDEVDPAPPSDKAPWLRNGPPFEQIVRDACRSPMPGFPSLHALPLIAAGPRLLKLNCFGSPSRYSTLTLELPASNPDVLETTVKHLIGKSVYVDWPMTREAKLVRGRDAKRTTTENGTIRPLDEDEAKRASFENDSLRHRHLVGVGFPGDGGLETQSVAVVLTVAPVRGLGCDPITGALYKVFDEKATFDVPIQLALNAPPHGHVVDQRFAERPGLPIEQRFVPDSEVVVLTGRFRGAKGVVKAMAKNQKIVVRVREDQAFDAEPPFGFAVAKALAPVYASLAVAAQALKLAPEVFRLIVSSFVVADDQKKDGDDDFKKYDLGLRLVFRPVDAGKEDESFLLLGYCRRNHEEKTFEYSAAAIRLVDAYREAFPAVFEAAAAFVSGGKKSKKRTVLPKTIFGHDEPRESLRKCLAYLERLPTTKAPRLPQSSSALTADAVKAIHRAAAKRATILAAPSATRNLEIDASSVCPAANAINARRLVFEKRQSFKLGDRIVNLAVPGVSFGERGVVVALHATGDLDVVFDNPFASGTNLQGACDQGRGALCDPGHVFALRLNADDAPEQPQPQHKKPETSYAAAVAVDEDDEDEIVLIGNNKNNNGDSDDKPTVVEQPSTKASNRLLSNRVAKGPDGTKGFLPEFSAGRRAAFEAQRKERELQRKREEKQAAANARAAGGGLILAAMELVHRTLKVPDVEPQQHSPPAINDDDELDDVPDAEDDAFDEEDIDDDFDERGDDVEDEDVAPPLSSSPPPPGLLPQEEPASVQDLIPTPAPTPAKEPSTTAVAPIVQQKETYASRAGSATPSQRTVVINSTRVTVLQRPKKSESAGGVAEAKEDGRKSKEETKSVPAPPKMILKRPQPTPPDNAPTTSRVTVEATPAPPQTNSRENSNGFSDDWAAQSDARLRALEERVRESVKEKTLGPYLTEEKRSSVTDKVVGFTFGLQPVLPSSTSEKPDEKKPYAYAPQTSTTARVRRKPKTGDAAASSSLVPPSVMMKPTSMLMPTQLLRRPPSKKQQPPPSGTGVKKIEEKN